MTSKSLEICQIPPSKCQPIFNLECKDRFFLIVCDQLVPKLYRNIQGTPRNAQEAFRQIPSLSGFWAANWAASGHYLGRDCSGH